MALVGFQYEPVSSDVNEVCFEAEYDITNSQEKVKKLTNGVDVGTET